MLQFYGLFLFLGRRRGNRLKSSRNCNVVTLIWFYCRYSRWAAGSWKLWKHPGRPGESFGGLLMCVCFGVCGLWPVHPLLCDSKWPAWHNLCMSHWAK